MGWVFPLLFLLTGCSPHEGGPFLSGLLYQAGRRLNRRPAAIFELQQFFAADYMDRLGRKSTEIRTGQSCDTGGGFAFQFFPSDNRDIPMKRRLD